MSDEVTAFDLEDQARAFAWELTDTVQAVVPGCAPFEAMAMTGPADLDGFTVGQVPKTGIRLQVGRVDLLTLAVSYHCKLDHERRYLAVDMSEFKVFPMSGTDHEPLFRYEYVREAASDIPAAHIQVHAHRDAVAYVMARAGTATRRGKRRSSQTNIPHLHELHFPVGGHRFRPCLEDVLEMLVQELGVDAADGWRDALRRGRERWRRKQVRSVVRDAPADAVATLTELGYDVVPRAGITSPPDNLRRLNDF